MCPTQLIFRFFLYESPPLSAPDCFARQLVPNNGLSEAAIKGLSECKHVLSSSLITWGLPVSAASFVRSLRISVVSAFCFSSLNRTFIGTATDFCMRWGDSRDGTRCLRLLRLLNSVTKTSIMYRTARLWSSAASFSSGRKSAHVRLLRCL